MATVFDVAKYILQNLGTNSIWKLHKLCYYSQAWALAWTRKPIFDEDFEAWSNGPVCRELYDLHKGLFFTNEQNLQCGNSDNLTSDERDTMI